MSQFLSASGASLPSRRSLLACAGGGVLAAGLSACAMPTRLAAVPSSGTRAATVLGVPNERFFVTDAAGQAGLQQEFINAVSRLDASRGLPATAGLPAVDL